MLTDREVSPQLGLLKSTLLQLDSSFSERDYGVSSFREFADKLAQAGPGHAEAPGPQHAGRTADGSSRGTAGDAEPVTIAAPRRPSDAVSSAREAGRQAARELLEQPDSGPGVAELDEEKSTRASRDALAR